jgi:hypothetical protein
VAAAGGGGSVHLRTSRGPWAKLCGVGVLLLGLASPALAKHADKKKHAEVSEHAESAASAHETDSQELAKKLSNPISDLVSVPFQFNWENGVGPDNGLKTVLNIQPVVPFEISPKWNLIERWIMPYVSQPEYLNNASGLGDITFSSFLSPNTGKSLIWGVGPVVALPMSSDAAVGSGQWSAGPTAVVLKLQGDWIYGLLWNQLWSYATVSDRARVAVNQGFFQPFIALTRPSGVTFTLQSESIANWNAAENSTWTIPITVTVAKMTTLGPFPFSVLGGAGVYVAKPDVGPDWKLRAAFTLVLPRRK